MSADLIAQLTQLVTAIGVIAHLAFAWWKAARDFENNKGQNQALTDLKAQSGVAMPEPPPQPRRRQSGVSRLLPRAPTPLPFWPIESAVPEPIEAETSTTNTDRNKGG